MDARTPEHEFCDVLLLQSTDGGSLGTHQADRCTWTGGAGGGLRPRNTTMSTRGYTLKRRDGTLAQASTAETSQSKPLRTEPRQYSDTAGSSHFNESWNCHLYLPLHLNFRNRSWLPYHTANPFTKESVVFARSLQDISISANSTLPAFN